MPPNDVPRAPPSGRVFGTRVGPPSPFASAPGRAAPPADDDAGAELDAELVRADAHVRSASVGLWLVVIVAAICALGFVAAALFLQG